MQSRIVLAATRTSFIAATALLMGGMSLLAQVANGQLAGTIYDQAGARLQQATVTVRNVASGFETLARATNKGEYRFESLPIGKYSVRASAKGLTTVQINDILIQSNKTANINVTLPESRNTPISVVEVSEAPEPADATAPAATTAPGASPITATNAQEDAKILDPKVVVGEINAIRDRLALSAEQQAKIHAVLQQRQEQIVAIRADNSLTLPERREKIKAARVEADTKFRALLNEDQLDEYEEILRERRERALQHKQEASLASH